MRALEREPERRFSSVTELSEALCFAAGIQTRSHGTPPSYLVGAPGYGAGTAHSVEPSPNAYGPAGHHGLGAPAPGAMTNAPFTREETAGVPSSGNGKWVLGGLAAGIVAVAAVVGILVSLRKPAVAQPDATNGVGIVASSVSVATTEKPAEVNPEPTAAPVAKKTAESKPADPPPKPTSKTPPPPPVAKPAATVPAKTASTPPPPPPPPPATPPPTPVTKKPNKNDPGY
jgi:hypothetical protein